jgi:hypothetical protein
MNGIPTSRAQKWRQLSAPALDRAAPASCDAACVLDLVVNRACGVAKDLLEILFFEKGVLAKAHPGPV